MRYRVFRFRLGRDSDSGWDSETCDNAVTEMIRSQLENILKVALLTCQGQGVMVDGFKLLVDNESRDIVYTIFKGVNAQSYKKYTLSELLNGDIY